MRVVNELRRVVIHSTPRQEVAAFVRVRGVDLRVGGQGIVYESRQPTAILVRDPNKVRRVSLQPERDVARTVMFAAAPLLAMWAARRLNSNKLR